MIYSNELKKNNAKNRFKTKINRNMVMIKGTQGRYSSSPIWVLVKSQINSRIYLTKFSPLVGMVSRFRVAKKARLNKIAITI